jgi:hypothetical protein
LRTAGLLAKSCGLCLAVAMGAVPVPRIASIDFYGLHRIPEDRIQRALGLKAGDSFPPSKGDIEDRIEQIPGVLTARLEAVCCDRGEGILFVGVEEKGGVHFRFHSPPSGTAVLESDIVAVYHDLVQAVQAAARRGSTREDLTQGHPLMADPDARAIQQQFPVFVKERITALRDVLRNSTDEEHRAIAAMILGYAPDKTTVVGDLEYAMQDPVQGVRSSAMRALNAIAVLARLQPDLGIKIHPTWFIEMLNSVVLTDRTRALDALVTLTDSRDPNTLAQLHDRALASLAEMAQWKSLPHALPAFLLVGRVGNVTEEQIHANWTRGDRAAMIQRVVNPGRAKKQK